MTCIFNHITGYWFINEEFNIESTENNIDVRTDKNFGCLDKIQEIDLSDIDLQTQTYNIITNSAPYRYIPALKKNRLDFSVKAISDAHISLSNAAQLMVPKIIIIIGGWSNSASTIRINDIDVIKNNTPGILDKDEFRGFWIKWSQDRNILVGKRNEDIPFLVYRHTERLFPINFIGVSCLFNHITGHWIINDV
ncbi:uncharacterized protein LOC129618629 [Condylostylus longicornis]|uniref:uncharacterized protein LOC129618629 n=1 Tax=Condylostylus longicornis TaxID=2530218 RepID=UPI00244E302C|nr:uncharacterized protein LOC129618629 [Condylostylus longicornis]